MDCPNAVLEGALRGRCEYTFPFTMFSRNNTNRAPRTIALNRFMSRNLVLFLSWLFPGNSARLEAVEGAVRLQQEKITLKKG